MKRLVLTAVLALATACGTDSPKPAGRPTNGGEIPTGGSDGTPTGGSGGTTPTGETGGTTGGAGGTTPGGSGGTTGGAGGTTPGGSGGTTGGSGGTTPGGSGGTTGGGSSGTTPAAPQVVTLDVLRNGSVAVGTLVEVHNVYVTAMSGNKKSFYVAESSGSAGMLVERCTSCTWTAPARGTTVSFKGYYKLTGNDARISVGAAGVTVATDPVDAPPYATASAADVSISSTDTDLLGLPVHISDGPFTISSVTPVQGKNPTYDATGNGCTKGPEYFSIEVTSASGAKILVTTSCYRDIDITTTQGCSTSSQLLQADHMFSTLSGIFDSSYGVRVLIPTSKADYVYQ
jgi:hypothetical protein